jgi:hypothetical protein
MPLIAEEYTKCTEAIHEIKTLLMAHPDTAYSLYEIEESLIGPGMNCEKRLDFFIAALTLHAPLPVTKKEDRAPADRRCPVIPVAGTRQPVSRRFLPA